jgi:peptide/nickel transport system permease protein
MIRFALRRLLATIPTLIGISLATFVLVNLSFSPLATSPGDPARSDTISSSDAERLGRAYGLHLPLFFNPDIEDVRERTRTRIERLSEPGARQRAVRSLARTGGAALPYLVPELPHLAGEPRRAALDALDAIASRVGVARALEASSDRAAFWTRYWDVYGSDYTPVRAARLVRRLSRHEDELAREELRRLDTFCLPQLMDALEDVSDPAAQQRLVSMATELTAREDPIDPAAPAAERRRVVERWAAWWEQRYDLYSNFEGFERITGSITETRYFRWLERLATFDFGRSARDGRPVREKLAERLPVTLLLSLLALLLAYGVAIPLGVLSAERHGRTFDRVTTAVMLALYSLPALWIALLAVRYLGESGAGLFPSQGMYSPEAASLCWWRRALDAAHHLVLPVLTLSFVSLAMLTRYQRVGMLRVVDADFVRAARAKGVGRSRAIWRHGLRNGVIPVITIFGLQLPYLVGGSVVVERIFGIPGMGLETFEAIRAGDHYWLTAAVAVTAAMTVLGVVLADVIYALVDPRIVPGRSQWRRA